ncbi:tyrosine-type recombinase/integrase [Bosea eneae]|uniref:Tyrosine-type recombinase/integrase n=1 Tax=Bosea eneae TaxID=151454 RepID=A0ABW0J182_9HYPH
MIDAVTVSPLRRRMIEDMTIRRFGEHTQRDYVRQVREFTTFLGLPPDRAEPEDLRRYQLHLASLGASHARMNLACTALRFFFHVTLGRIGFGDRMARIPTPERLPVVLDTQEVALLLAHARSLKDRAALSIAYGCGLRVSEIANLKVADIDSARMLIRVEQGKNPLHLSDVDALRKGQLSGPSYKQTSAADARVLSELIIRVWRDDFLIGLVVLAHYELGLVGHALKIPVEVRGHIGFAQFQFVVSEILELFFFRRTIGKQRRIQNDEPRMWPSPLYAKD